jgi:glycine oxidase
MSILDTLQSNETADVVVIGGGVIGLTVARALALRGVTDVLLLERGDLGAESSFAAGGMLAPQVEADSADEFFQFACKSRDLYPAFAAALLEETGSDIELETTGTLYLAFTEHDEAESDRRYEWQTRAGLTVEKVDPADARAMEPCISESLRGALKFPRDIQVDNRRLLTALVKSNELLDVRLGTNTKVTAIRLEHGRVAGLETSKGFVSTRRIVVAGGAWTSLISISDQSLMTHGQVAVEPVRGQMMCFATNPRLARHVLYSPRGYLVPRLDGRVLAGSTTEHVGFAKEVTAEGLAAIRSHAFEIAPVLSTFPLVDSWAGLRPRAADGLPILGPRETEGLLYATGHYRNGILLAPITGQLIAEAIVDNVVAPELSQFAPGRFDLVGVH